MLGTVYPGQLYPGGFRAEDKIEVPITGQANCICTAAVDPVNVKAITGTTHCVSTAQVRIRLRDVQYYARFDTYNWKAEFVEMGALVL